MLPGFCIPVMSHCFQRILKTQYLLLHFLKACQSALTFLTYNFITTTILINVLGKTEINIAHLIILHILPLITEFDYPERC